MKGGGQMSLITVEGGRRLCGEMAVQSAKNSVLPILAATILGGDVCVIRACPRLRDVETATEILHYLGCDVHWEADDLVVDTATVDRCDIPENLMRQ